MNQYILVSVLLVFFVYYGGKYVPPVIKKNKEILLGVVGGLVLCSFIGLRMEGLCSVREEDLNKVENDCGNLDSMPTTCPSERCAKTLISWFRGNGGQNQGCTGGEILFPNDVNDIFYTGLQTLTESCENLLSNDLGNLSNVCPNGINQGVDITCGCAMKDYINLLNNGSAVGDSFWRSSDINNQLSDLYTLIANPNDHTPRFVRDIYDRSDLICTSPKGPNAPTPPPDPPDIQWSQCTQDLSVPPVYRDSRLNSAPESITNLNTACIPSAGGYLVQPPIFDFRSTAIARNPNEASMTPEERIAAATSIYNTYPSWRNDGREMVQCTENGARGRVTRGDPESCANKLTEWWGGCIRDHNEHPEAWGIRTNIIGSEGRKLQDAAGYSGGELGYEFFDQIRNFQGNYEECGGTERLNSDGPNCSDGCVGPHP